MDPTAKVKTDSVYMRRKNLQRKHRAGSGKRKMDETSRSLAEI
jgi:hypothetical protein